MNTILPVAYTRPYIPGMTISDRLDSLMKTRRVKSQSALSRLSKVPQPTINRILKGTTANPDMPTLQKLAAALESNVNWLAEGIGPGPDSPDHRPKASNDTSQASNPEVRDGNGTQIGSSPEGNSGNTYSPNMRTETGNVPVPLQYSVDNRNVRRVFVIGRAQGGMPERLWTDGDYPVGATDEFAEIATTDPHAFLSPIVGTSMSPRYNPGEFALVEPATEPELEDDVLVRLATGETMLKRLVSRRGGITLASYNEPGTLLFKEADITWLYYVAHPVPARKIKQRM